MTKRGRLEIIHDILSAVKEKEGKIKPTHILYKSNLSPQMFSYYMDELVSKSFIEEKEDKRGRKTYVLKERGENYLRDYSRIKGFVDSYGLD
jgi:predicted transcriptional regulator